MHSEKGLLIVLSAPSGAGKGTVIERILEKNKNVKVSISATTRQKRESEIDGKNYFFTSTNDFETMIKEDGLLEYATYCENYYGTPKKAVDNWRNEGLDVILEIEVQGAKQVLEKCTDAVSIFILPPSMQVLKERLINRGTETSESLSIRLKTAKEEINRASLYDYVVINDDLDRCVADICSIINCEKLKTDKMKNFINEVLLQCEDHQ